MRRTTLASAFIAAFFLLATGPTSPVNANIADDNGTRIATGPYILFPVNTTYNSRFLTLNISFSAQLFSNVRFSATYSLDGTTSATVPLVSSPSLIWNKNRVTGSVRLPELQDGPHRLAVYLEAKVEAGDSYWDRETVYFTVETTQPKIKVLSPLNQTYNQTSLSLAFTLDKQVNWTGYSLDGQDNVTICGNLTVTGLLNGVHNVTIYANDTYGNMGESETVRFTVAVPETFPFVSVIAAIMISVAVIVGLLFHFKKQNTKQQLGN